jgi:uncharacterized membrane protein
MLLPILVGLLLWDKLPEQVPYHWGINGEVDGWANKTQAVFLMPCLMLVLHWVCVLASCADPKRGNYNNKSFLLVLWICPVINLLLNTLVYATALEYTVSVQIIMPLFMGVLFLLVGNYLPKCKQSYTIGIKLPWTLHNEENWNKTHRFGGKVMVAGAIVILATAFLGSFWILLGVLIVMVALPTIYSYCLYRKQVRDAKE